MALYWHSIFYGVIFLCMDYMYNGDCLRDSTDRLRVGKNSLVISFLSNPCKPAVHVIYVQRVVIGGRRLAADMEDRLNATLIG